MFSCFCFGSRPQGNTKQKKQNQKQKEKKQNQKLNDKSPSSAHPASDVPVPQTVQASEHEGRTRSFTYRELATATNNFRAESMIGRGGFGRVFKGTLESTGQEVAVKVLDPEGAQGEREFLVEVLMLSLIRHENLVRLIGYCDEGEQRLLVYEYMPLGSVEDHMHNDNIGRETLDWNTRMRIAAGAAKGLQQLHNVAVPPVIFRDLKSANILLDEGFNAKLSDFGLARFGPTGDASHISTNVMGTLGYCAPEYAQSGKLTIKSDIYSFGVVLLELISGRKALTGSSSMNRQCFIGDWALALFKKNKLNDIVDPMITIKGRHMEATLRKALEVAFMCIKEEANDRPTIREIVIALNYIVKCTTCKKKKKRSGSGSGGDSEKTGSSSEGTSRNLNEELDRKRRVAEAKDWAIDHLKRKSIEQPSSSSSYKT